MLIFIAIAIGSFIFIAGSFLFGHDHDADHHDIGHGAEGHDISQDMEPTISFFSVKVLATLTMGFGAAGAIARQYGADYLVASLSLSSCTSSSILSISNSHPLWLRHLQQSDRRVR